MNAKTRLPLIAIALFVLGFVVLKSPFWITGGVVGIFTGCKGGELREYFFGHNFGKHVFEDLFSILLGVGLMIGGAILGMTVGLVLGIQATSSEKSKALTARDTHIHGDDTTTELR